MDEKSLKGHKTADRVKNPTNFKESKLIKYRKNKKASIDVKFETKLITSEDTRLIFEKYGSKNDDGSFTIGGNDQLIKEYMDKLYSILKSLGLPSDDTVKYKPDGSVVALDSDERGCRVWVYLRNERYANIPNVHRIGWLLGRFYNIKLSLSRGDLKSVVNSLLFAIEEYSNIILISIEGDIVPHTTQAATEERIFAKSERIRKTYKLADEILKEKTHIKTKSDIARLIAKQTGWSIHTIRQDYLKDYLIKL
mgnify:CR=1 FL=1|tara:strand:+ start:6610 stop:7365 length:756 start_codon:yes stop_codon:yes gene_type:complete